MRRTLLPRLERAAYIYLAAGDYSLRDAIAALLLLADDDAEVRHAVLDRVGIEEGAAGAAPEGVRMEPGQPCAAVARASLVPAAPDPQPSFGAARRPTHLRAAEENHDASLGGLDRSSNPPPPRVAGWASRITIRRGILVAASSSSSISASPPGRARPRRPSSPAPRCGGRGQVWGR